MVDVELLLRLPTVSHPPCPTLPPLSNHKLNNGKPMGQWSVLIDAGKWVLGFFRVKKYQYKFHYFIYWLMTIIVRVRDSDYSSIPPLEALFPHLGTCEMWPD